MTAACGRHSVRSVTAHAYQEYVFCRIREFPEMQGKSANFPIR
jgi:hypothetical protein